MKNKTGLLLLAGITVFSTLSSSGQNAPVPAQEKMMLHHETLGDKYLPNAYDNQRTSPAYKYRSSGAVKTMSSISTIFTTQVNVNSGGQNIVGDAANEPGIALNPLDANKIVIGWRQFDNVSSNFRQAGWSFTSDAGQTWTFPGVIEQGIFRSDPVLDYDSSGNFYYNSLTITPDYFCKVFKSTNGGATWDGGTNAQGGDKQWMAIDRTAGAGSGNIYSFWSLAYSTCQPDFFTRSTNGNSSYENCTAVDGNPFWGTMAIDNSGNLYIAGAVQFAGIVVCKSLNAQIAASVISWNPDVWVDMDGYLDSGPNVNPGGLMGQANIDVDRSNGAGQDNVYVLAPVVRFSVFDPGDIMFARSTDGGLTWSSPIRINDDGSTLNTQWFGTLSVAPNGRIDAVWLDTRDNPGSDWSALYYSYSTDQGNTWSANEMMSASFDPHVGYPNQNKMGDYFDMISLNSGAHLAWANTLNGEQDVYYSHIVPPVATTVDVIANSISVSVYPNPTDGIFSVRSGEMLSHIEIMNVLGEKIFSIPVSNFKSEINITTQPSGIYFMKIVYQDGRVVVRKIIMK
ncbi:MAG TPA: T9SS type A sorting domain-containing protein [Bacteroidia bacterium]|nr:T9SS type A sorting domain-containing protein [Bacteroidia bacterium]